MPSTIALQSSRRNPGPSPKDCYAMPYDKTDPYQKAFARWVNRRLCRTVPWEDYSYGDWPRRDAS